MDGGTRNADGAGGSDHRVMPLGEAAETMGVSRKNLQRAIKDGMPATVSGRHTLVDLGEAEAWMAERGRGVHSERLNPSDELRTERIRKERALADKHELMVAQLRGHLVEKSEAQAWWRRRVEVMKAKLLAIPATLSATMEGMDGPARQVEIERAIRAALESLAGELGH